MPPSPKTPRSLNPPSVVEAGRLYPIVDAEACAAAGRAPIDVAQAFLAAGARWLQLRCKNMASGEFLDLANRCLAQTRAAGATLIVNDRADVTALSGADGCTSGKRI